MVRVGFVMRAHPLDDGACLVSGAVKAPYRLLRQLRSRVAVTGVVVVDHRGGFDGGGYPVEGGAGRSLRLYAKTLVWNLSTLPAVLRLHRRSDVVQCHHPNFGLGAAVARRWGRGDARLVVKAHGTGTAEHRAVAREGLRGHILTANAALHRWHDRWVLAQADLCLVSSDFQLAEMTATYGVAPERLRRIYNGADPDYVTVRNRDGGEAVASPRLVYVGRVAPKKGLRQLRNVFIGLRARHPGATLALVLGHRSAVEDAATYRFVEHELAALPGCTTYWDLDEAALYGVLASADIGVVPSEGYESIPTVVLEMCRAGLPVFATYRWGIPEVLPERFGLTGDVGVDVERIAAFVELELASWDSAEWAACYEKFDYDRIVPEYLAAYEEQLQRAGA